MLEKVGKRRRQNDAEKPECFFIFSFKAMVKANEVKAGPMKRDTRDRTRSELSSSFEYEVKTGCGII
jgi:hypothetical protein